MQLGHWKSFCLVNRKPASKIEKFNPPCLLTLTHVTPTGCPPCASCTLNNAHRLVHLCGAERLDATSRRNRCRLLRQCLSTRIILRLLPIALEMQFLKMGHGLPQLASNQKIYRAQPLGANCFCSLKPWQIARHNCPGYMWTCRVPFAPSNLT